MNVAITGATGFLGRYLARHLTDAGHACRGLIRPDSRHAGTRPAIEWVTGGLDDPSALRSLVEGVEAVVHAAHDAPGTGFMDPAAAAVTLVERNLITTLRLVEAAKLAGVGRFVVVSSGAVHDEILADRPLDEAHPNWPKSHYGATKAAIEAFVSSFGRGEGFPITALRPTSIYGLAEPIAASRWYGLAEAVIRGEEVTCRKGGKQVHAADVAHAVELLLTAAGTAGEVYDCTDRFVAEREVAEIARSTAGAAGSILGDAPTGRHPIECAKLKRLGMTFGGRPLLEATIRAMVQSIQEQPWR